MTNIQKTIDGKRILVTGGTGSFGNYFVEKILSSGQPKEIIIFSRDEKKQHDMRVRFRRDELNFTIGDVRDRESVFKAMKGVDYVFHAAALKHVPSCEFFPIEAIKTNVLGANNVLDAAEEYEIKKVVVLSTDKAVYPINAMGMSKAIMEKLMLAKARSRKSKTVFCGVRYGNVMYSRGSVLPLFVEQIRLGRELTVTHPDMTRYLLPLPVAIELVLFAIDKGENGDVLVRKSPAATVKDMAEAVKQIFNYKKAVKSIGIREGEKMHETLVTREELLKATEYDDYYRIKNLSEIDYESFLTHGQSKEFSKEGYTSENTRQLSLKQTVDFIHALAEIKDELHTHQSRKGRYAATNNPAV